MRRAWRYFVSLAFVASGGVLAGELAKPADRLTAPIKDIESTSPGSHRYQLAHSMDDKLCRHMMELLNSDLQKYGYEQSAMHEEFKSVPWRKAQFQSESRGQKSYFPAKGALLDIDNDGTSDFVVKWEASLGGILKDALYVLNREAASRAEMLTNRELFQSKNKIDLAGFVYPLDSQYALDGEAFGILEPFIFDKKVYIYARPFFELAPATYHTTSIVARYGGGRIDNTDQSGKLAVLCYFRRTADQKPN